MDTILVKELNCCIGKRNLSVGSGYTYEKTIKKFIKEYEQDNNAEYQGVNWIIDNNEMIVNFINNSDWSYAKKKKILSTLLVLISPAKHNPLDQHTYNLLNALLKKQNDIYNEKISGNKKTEKDIKKWKSWKEIMSVQKNLRKQYLNAETNSRQLELKADLFIVSLYTLMKPRRLEYADALVMSNARYKKLEINGPDKDLYENNVILVRNTAKPFFHFGINSSKVPTPEPVIIEIPHSMREIAKTLPTYWRRDAPTIGKNTLLAQLFKENKNQFGIRIQNIFKRYDMDISVVMLRKIYLSEKYASIKEEQKEDAESMNHSVEVQQNIYVKKEE